MNSSKQPDMGSTNSPKAKPGTSRISSLLSKSEIESLRQEAKQDQILMQEILAKEEQEILAKQAQN